MTTKPTRRASVTLIGCMALGTALGASNVYAVSQGGAANQIRSNTVINLCDMYKGMFQNILAIQDEPGYDTSLLFDVAQAEQNPQVKAFLVSVAERISRTRNPRSQSAILSSTAEFTQPCYNAVAASYDTALSEPAPYNPTYTPQPYSAPTQRPTSPSGLAAPRSDNNPNTNYSNSRR